MRYLTMALVCAVIAMAAACSGSDPCTSQSDGSASSSGAGGSGGACNSSGGHDAGTHECIKAVDCDDVNLCTIDECSRGTCEHVRIVNLPECVDAGPPQCRRCMGDECPLTECLDGIDMICPPGATPPDGCALLADGTWCC